MENKNKVSLKNKCVNEEENLNNEIPSNNVVSVAYFNVISPMSGLTLLIAPSFPLSFTVCP